MMGRYGFLVDTAYGVGDEERAGNFDSITEEFTLLLWKAFEWRWRKNEARGMTKIPRAIIPHVLLKYNAVVGLI